MDLCYNSTSRRVLETYIWKLAFGAKAKQSVNRVGYSCIDGPCMNQGDGICLRAVKYESIAARLREVDVDDHGVSVDCSSPSERIRRVETNCAACQPVRGVDYFYAKMVFVDC